MCRMRKLTTILLLTPVFLVTSCRVVFPPHKNSEKSKNECVTIRRLPKEDTLQKIIDLNDQQLCKTGDLEKPIKELLGDKAGIIYSSILKEKVTFGEICKKILMEKDKLKNLEFGGITNTPGPDPDNDYALPFSFIKQKYTEIMKNCASLAILNRKVSDHFREIASCPRKDDAEKKDLAKLVSTLTSMSREFEELSQLYLQVGSSYRIRVYNSDQQSWSLLAFGAGYAADMADKLIVWGAEKLLDYVQSELEKEAKKYSAEYGKRTGFGTFWITHSIDKIKTAYIQKHNAFEVTRTVDIDGVSQEALTMTCLMIPTEDYANLQIQPINLCLKKTKVKILTKEPYAWWTYELCWWNPFSWVNMKAGSKVNFSVGFKVYSDWLTNEDYNKAIIGEDTFTFNGYDIENPKPVPLARFAEQSIKGRIRSIPLSTRKTVMESSTTTVTGQVTKTKKDSQEKIIPVGSGNYSLRVDVYEKDPSNAEKYVTDGAELIKKEKDGWVKKIPSVRKMPVIKEMFPDDEEEDGK